MVLLGKQPGFDGRRSVADRFAQSDEGGTTARDAPLAESALGDIQLSGEGRRSEKVIQHRNASTGDVTFDGGEAFGN